MNVTILARPPKNEAESKSFTLYGFNTPQEAIDYIKELIKKNNPENLIK